MIDALLDVSRLDLGEQIELVRSPINLFEVVSRIAAEHQERAPWHRIQVAGETAENPQMRSKLLAAFLALAFSGRLDLAVEY